MATTTLLGQLLDLSRTRRLRCRDYWYGLSHIAPIDCQFDLIRKADGSFTGVGYMETNQITHRTLSVEITPERATEFLSTVSSAVLTSEAYTPFIDHTDDCPRIEVRLSDAADLASHEAPSVILSTESQGEFHSPWEVQFGAESFVAAGDEIGRAWKMLALGRDERREMCEESERISRESLREPAAKPEYSEKLARQEHCWFKVDRAPRDRPTTHWKRLARFRQSQWRTAHGFPIGSEPYRGGRDAEPVGSRMELDFARKTGANFISAAALAAVHSRLNSPEPHQTLSEDRLWADLLSSMPLCFNLFGDLAWDRELASSAVAAWWPDLPAGRVTLRFEHSPGRRDPSFLGNRTAFDVAIEIDTPTGIAVVGVEVKYHEHAIAGKRLNLKALARCAAVTEQSAVFKQDWKERVVETDLQQIWLDHILVLSMLQHPSKRWSAGRFVLVYPSENPSFRSAARRYRDVLRETNTFEDRTIESLIRDLRFRTRTRLLERYLP
jgi:hypothetical protein